VVEVRDGWSHTGEAQPGDQHIEQAAQSALQGDFTRLAIFMGFPASQFGQQLDFDQPHRTGDPLARTLATDVRGVGHAHGTGGYLHFDRLLLGGWLLASFDHQRRLDTCQGSHLSACLLQLALLPLPVPILKADQPLQMIDATDQIILCFPNRAPLSSSQVTILCSLREVSAWLTLCSASWTSAGPTRENRGPDC